MRGECRKIDPNLHLGLQELANSGEGRGSFRFQLAFAMEQAEDILGNLDSLVKNTIDKAPIRKGEFPLDRTTAPESKHKAGDLTREEDKWERAMYEEWGPEGSGEFISVCKRIQTYQYPLKDSHKDKRWGKIDLLGIGTNFLPVPIELKKGEAAESPLRMLVEVAAYGFAIREAWPKLRNPWIEAVSWFGGSPSQFPATLDKVTLIGVAPEAYWRQCLGNKAGAFPSEAWPPFWKLMDALEERGFDIHFVAIKGSCDTTDKSATITGARVLDLRNLTLKPAADTHDLGQ